MRIPFRALALAALAANSFHVLAGLGHLFGSFASRAGSEYDFHFAALMLVGWDLVAPAAGQLLLVRPMWRGERWAFGVSAALASYQAVAFALLAPFTLAGVASALTILYAAAVPFALRRAHDTSGAEKEDAGAAEAADARA